MAKEEKTLLVCIFFKLLVFSDISYEIGFNLIKWVYTDLIENSAKHDEDFYLEMMKQADRFGLKELKLK
jgi:hypothetical protein